MRRHRRHGAPLTLIPFEVWRRCRPGVDVEWLTLVTGGSGQGRVGGWSYSYRLARFLSPVVLSDTATRVGRDGVVAQFADPDPAAGSRPALPPIILGLWGGLLDGGRILGDADPATGSVRGAIEFP